MTDDDRINDDLRMLLIAASAGEIDEPQWLRLEALIRQSESAREYAVLILQQMSALEWSSSDAVAQVESTLRHEVPGEPRKTLSGLSFKRRTQRAILFSAVSAIAAMLMIGIVGSWLVFYTNRQLERKLAAAHEAASDSPPHTAPSATDENRPWVARLKRSSVDATWKKSSAPHEFLLRLQSDQAVELLSGFAELEFVSGAVLILHGPSAITPTGPDSAVLRSGRVTGRADNGNFHLLTPSARVDDLGTEFGVVVDELANTGVVVFEGDVNVSPTNFKKRRVNTIYLDGGATAQINHDGEFATGVPIEQSAFKRVFPREPSEFAGSRVENSLSLIDIINGGDGHESILAGAIDPLTGTWEQRPWQNETGPGRAPTDWKYHRSLSHPMIDGVFIPGKKGRRTKITSAGHRVDLPANIGQSWGPIWGRRRVLGDMPTPKDDFWGTSTLPYIVRRISDSHDGALGLHPNVGITFDLRECRSLYGDRVRRLEARVVNLDLMAETRSTDLRRVRTRTADFWVYVDGKLKYSRRNFGRDWEGEPVSVELGSEARFLTLVSTDGGNETSYDQVMLIDPVLILSDAIVPATSETKSE